MPAGTLGLLGPHRSSVSHISGPGQGPPREAPAEYSVPPALSTQHSTPVMLGSVPRGYPVCTGRSSFSQP